MNRRVSILLAGAVLVACAVEPDSGVGQGPSSGDMQWSSTASEVDSGLDDTSDVEPLPPPVPRSYFIAESMDYTGNGCEHRDVNEVTVALRDALDGDGWVGSRITESQTRPLDFIDALKSSLARSDATQIFAFNNSPIIWGNSARRFFRKTQHVSNRDAWITVMEDRPGFKSNSPVVYTRGKSEDQVLQIHRAARLSRIDETLSQKGTTWFAYT